MKKLILLFLAAGLASLPVHAGMGEGSTNCEAMSDVQEEGTSETRDRGFTVDENGNVITT